MTIESELALIESKLQSALGESTVLSDPENNAASPLTQLGLYLATMGNDTKQRLDNLKKVLNLKTLPCDLLDQIAPLIGFQRQVSGIQPKQLIVFYADYGFVLPSGTEMIDGLGRSWFVDNDYPSYNGLGHGYAKGSINYTSVQPNELSLASHLSAIKEITNVIEVNAGSPSESCEDFRKRLLNEKPVPETESFLFSKVRKFANDVKLTKEIPDCIEGVGDLGIVVNGGDDNDVANAILESAPVNVAKIRGNEQVAIGCNNVRFIRPCPVGVIFKYWASKEIDNQSFIDALCKYGMDIGKVISSIECLTNFEFKLIRSRSSESNESCDLPDSGVYCDQTVSLINDKCHCDVGCIETDFSCCHKLTELEYPIFISAQREEQPC